MLTDVRMDVQAVIPLVKVHVEDKVLLTYVLDVVLEAVVHQHANMTAIPIVLVRVVSQCAVLNLLELVKQTAVSTALMHHVRHYVLMHVPTLVQHALTSVAGVVDKTVHRIVHHRVVRHVD